MAHKIRLSQEDIPEFITDLACLGGVLIKPREVNMRTALKFTQKAWIKMQALVTGFDKEVAWHGLARKEEDGYVVDDILVYPQVVTASTVDTNIDEYGNWLSLLSDEEINSLHMQGHSHVNMGVSPSGVDISCENDVLSQVGDDGFYIFVIWNKKGDRTVRIFDFEDDIVYETSDVDVVVEDLDFERFVADAHGAVRSETRSGERFKEDDYYLFRGEQIWT